MAEKSESKLPPYRMSIVKLVI